ncbi:hypothetical protein D0Q02_15765 [Micromonospora craniellae]|uniref:Uncharacterized protein n=1 Tax=Micromonospora craniellae TaxID=2294034 RepID=A0A372FYK2_9ACTN|nr:hypothetical protein D0Q02_15765 [Micromonospora craniellae]
MICVPQALAGFAAWYGRLGNRSAADDRHLTPQGEALAAFDWNGLVETLNGTVEWTGRAGTHGEDVVAALAQTPGAMAVVRAYPPNRPQHVFLLVNDGTGPQGTLRVADAQQPASFSPVRGGTTHARITDPYLRHLFTDSTRVMIFDPRGEPTTAADLLEDGRLDDTTDTSSSVSALLDPTTGPPGTTFGSRAERQPVDASSGDAGTSVPTVAAQSTAPSQPSGPRGADPAGRSSESAAVVGRRRDPVRHTAPTPVGPPPAEEGGSQFSPPRRRVHWPDQVATVVDDGVASASRRRPSAPGPAREVGVDTWYSVSATGTQGIGRVEFSGDGRMRLRVAEGGSTSPIVRTVDAGGWRGSGDVLVDFTNEVAIDPASGVVRPATPAELKAASGVPVTVSADLLGLHVWSRHGEGWSLVSHPHGIRPSQGLSTESNPYTAPLNAVQQEMLDLVAHQATTHASDMRPDEAQRLLDTLDTLATYQLRLQMAQWASLNDEPRIPPPGFADPFSSPTGPGHPHLPKYRYSLGHHGRVIFLDANGKSLFAAPDLTPDGLTNFAQNVAETLPDTYRALAPHVHQAVMRFLESYDSRIFMEMALAEGVPLTVSVPAPKRRRWLPQHDRTFSIRFKVDPGDPRLAEYVPLVAAGRPAPGLEWHIPVNADHEVQAFWQTGVSNSRRATVGIGSDNLLRTPASELKVRFTAAGVSNRSFGSSQDTVSATKRYMDLSGVSVHFDFGAAWQTIELSEVATPPSKAPWRRTGRVSAPVEVGQKDLRLRFEFPREMSPIRPDGTVGLLPTAPLKIDPSVKRYGLEDLSWFARSEPDPATPTPPARRSLWTRVVQAVARGPKTTAPEPTGGIRLDALPPGEAGATVPRSERPARESGTPTPEAVTSAGDGDPVSPEAAANLREKQIDALTRVLGHVFVMPSKAPDLPRLRARVLDRLGAGSTALRDRQTHQTAWWVSEAAFLRMFQDIVGTGEVGAVPPEVTTGKKYFQLPLSARLLSAEAVSQAPRNPKEEVQRFVVSHDNTSEGGGISFGGEASGGARLPVDRPGEQSSVAGVEGALSFGADNTVTRSTGTTEGSGDIRGQVYVGDTVEYRLTMLVNVKIDTNLPGVDHTPVKEIVEVHIEIPVPQRARFEKLLELAISEPETDPMSTWSSLPVDRDPVPSDPVKAKEQSDAEQEVRYPPAALAAGKSMGKGGMERLAGAEAVIGRLERLAAKADKDVAGVPTLSARDQGRHIRALSAHATREALINHGLAVDSPNGHSWVETKVGWLGTTHRHYNVRLVRPADPVGRGRLADAKLENLPAGFRGYSSRTQVSTKLSFAARFAARWLGPKFGGWLRGTLSWGRDEGTGIGTSGFQIQATLYQGPVRFFDYNGELHLSTQIEYHRNPVGWAVAATRAAWTLFTTNPFAKAPPSPETPARTSPVGAVASAARTVWRTAVEQVSAVARTSSAVHTDKVPVSSRHLVPEFQAPTVRPSSEALENIGKVTELVPQKDRSVSGQVNDRLDPWGEESRTARLRAWDAQRRALDARLTELTKDAERRAAEATRADEAVKTAQKTKNSAEVNVVAAIEGVRDAVGTKADADAAAVQAADGVRVAAAAKAAADAAMAKAEQALSAARQVKADTDLEAVQAAEGVRVAAAARAEADTAVMKAADGVRLAEAAKTAADAAVVAATERVAAAESAKTAADAAVVAATERVAAAESAKTAADAATAGAQEDLTAAAKARDELAGRPLQEPPEARAADAAEHSDTLVDYRRGESAPLRHDERGHRPISNDDAVQDVLGADFLRNHIDHTLTRLDKPTAVAAHNPLRLLRWAFWRANLSPILTRELASRATDASQLLGMHVAGNAPMRATTTVKGLFTNTHYDVALESRPHDPRSAPGDPALVEVEDGDTVTTETHPTRSRPIALLKMDVAEGGMGFNYGRGKTRSASVAAALSLVRSIVGGRIDPENPPTLTPEVPSVGAARNSRRGMGKSFSPQAGRLTQLTRKYESMQADGLWTVAVRRRQKAFGFTFFERRDVRYFDVTNGIGFMATLQPRPSGPPTPPDARHTTLGELLSEEKSTWETREDGEAPIVLPGTPTLGDVNPAHAVPRIDRDRWVRNWVDNQRELFHDTGARERAAPPAPPPAPVHLDDVAEATPIPTSSPRTIDTAPAGGKLVWKEGLGTQEAKDEAREISDTASHAAAASEADPADRSADLPLTIRDLPIGVPVDALKSLVRHEGGYTLTADNPLPDIVATSLPKRFRKKDWTLTLDSADGTSPRDERDGTGERLSALLNLGTMTALGYTLPTGLKLVATRSRPFFHETAVVDLRLVRDPSGGGYVLTEVMPEAKVVPYSFRNNTEVTSSEHAKSAETAAGLTGGAPTSAGAAGPGVSGRYSRNVAREQAYARTFGVRDTHFIGSAGRYTGVSEVRAKTVVRREPSRLLTLLLPRLSSVLISRTEVRTPVVGSVLERAIVPFDLTLPDVDSVSGEPRGVVEVKPGSDLPTGAVAFPVTAQQVLARDITPFGVDPKAAEQLQDVVIGRLRGGAASGADPGAEAADAPKRWFPRAREALLDRLRGVVAEPQGADRVRRGTRRVVREGQRAADAIAALLSVPSLLRQVDLQVDENGMETVFVADDGVLTDKRMRMTTKVRFYNPTVLNWVNMWTEYTTPQFTEHKDRISGGHGRSVSGNVSLPTGPVPLSVGGQFGSSASGGNMAVLKSQFSTTGFLQTGAQLRTRVDARVTFEIDTKRVPLLAFPLGLRKPITLAYDVPGLFVFLTKPLDAITRGLTHPLGVPHTAGYGFVSREVFTERADGSPEAARRRADEVSAWFSFPPVDGARTIHVKTRPADDGSIRFESAGSLLTPDQYLNDVLVPLALDGAQRAKFDAIAFVSSHLGREGADGSSLAQRFADRLNVPIVAAPGRVYTDTGGHVVAGDLETVDGTTYPVETDNFALYRPGQRERHELLPDLLASMQSLTATEIKKPEKPAVPPSQPVFWDGPVTSTAMSGAVDPPRSSDRAAPTPAEANDAPDVADASSGPGLGASPPAPVAEAPPLPGTSGRDAGHRITDWDAVGVRRYAVELFGWRRGPAGASSREIPGLRRNRSRFPAVPAQSTPDGDAVPGNVPTPLGGTTATGGGDVAHSGADDLNGNGSRPQAAGGDTVLPAPVSDVSGGT